MKAHPTYAGAAAGERGAVAVMVAVLAAVLLGFAAFALDIPNLYVARNELQNAADAGALAGARYLYSDKGRTVNAGANGIAEDAAKANFSQRAAVEVQSVERGHWSFGLTTTLAKGFYPNDSLSPTPLWNVSTEVLDGNRNFINAIKVTAARSATPVASFFARIFGREGFAVTASAIAYIGFAGSVEPFSFDGPVTLCKQSITSGDEYDCSVGRMLNDTSDTAAWTTFEQPCSGSANAGTMKDMLSPCPTNGANQDPVLFGESMTATNGVEMSVFKALNNCWQVGQNDGDSIVSDKKINGGLPDQPWKLTLPVVDCPSGKISNCLEVKGAVEVQVVWMLEKANDAAPHKMGAWSSDSTDDATRWSSFVQAFQLKNNDGSPAVKNQKTIYFKPDCAFHEPTGTSDGENFGILADKPVLVK